MLVGAVLRAGHTSSLRNHEQAASPGRACSAHSWPEGTRGPSDGMGDVEGTHKVGSSRTAVLSSSMTLTEAERERGYLGVRC